MFCFEILRIFEEKSQKGANWKSRHIWLLRRSVGNPRRGVDLRQGVGCLASARPRCQNGTPRVRHDIAKLCRSVPTVHSEKILDFCFLNTSYSYTDSLRTLINYEWGFK